MVIRSEAKQTHPIPVDFLPTPAKEGREAVLSERRRYSRALAQAAVKQMELHEAAYTDPLTGLGNRLLFEEQFPKLFETAKANKLPIALGYGDVRGLKRTNDNDGHDKGDQLIKAAGRAFSDILREGDVAIHLSGDEFVAIMVGYAPAEGQTQAELEKNTIDRLSSSFERSALENGIPKERHVGIDMAITVMNDNDTPQTMLNRAETMMREHKDAQYTDLQEKGVTFQDRRLN